MFAQLYSINPTTLYWEFIMGIEVENGYMTHRLDCEGEGKFTLSFEDMSDPLVKAFNGSVTFADGTTGPGSYFIRFTNTKALSAASAICKEYFFYIDNYTINLDEHTIDVHCIEFTHLLKYLYFDLYRYFGGFNSHCTLSGKDQTTKYFIILGDEDHLADKGSSTSDIGELQFNPPTYYSLTGANIRSMVTRLFGYLFGKINNQGNSCIRMTTGQLASMDDYVYDVWAHADQPIMHWIHWLQGSYPSWVNPTLNGFDDLGSENAYVSFGIYLSANYGPAIEDTTFLSSSGALKDRHCTTDTKQIAYEQVYDTQPIITYKTTDAMCPCGFGPGYKWSTSKDLGKLAAVPIYTYGYTSSDFDSIAGMRFNKSIKYESAATQKYNRSNYYPWNTTRHLNTQYVDSTGTQCYLIEDLNKAEGDAKRRASADYKNSRAVVRDYQCTLEGDDRVYSLKPGDTVKIIDSDLGINLQRRVIALTVYFGRDDYTMSATLGD